MTDSAAFWSTYPNVNYTRVLEERRERLARIRANPSELPALREYYRRCPADFIADWGTTTDPRSIARGRPAQVPFIPTVRQRELVSWSHGCWRRGVSGVCVKTRDAGVSYVEMGLFVTLCIFEPNFAAGVSSAVEVKIDRSGDPDTLFFKAREFIVNLPPEFRGGYDPEKNSAYMRLSFPASGGSLTGEAGALAARGGRKSVYLVDEFAHFEHSQLIVASLSANTDCALYVSSVAGSGNAFFELAHNPAIARFDLTWRDDPRKNFPGSTWYEEKCRTTDPIIIAQEVDCNFYASTTGQLIPAAHIHSAIGAAQKLGLGAPSGAKCGALDPADVGKDKNALAIRHGSSLVFISSWSGKNSDLYKTTARAFGVCDQHGGRELHFDADGLGSAIRGDAESVNAKRVEAGKEAIEVKSYRGSGQVFDPAGSLLEGVANRDAFLNQKAMSGFALRGRFEYTHRVVEAHARGEPIEFDPEGLIDIDPNLPELNQLITELSQPVYSYTAAGKRQIDKSPDNIASPNLYDAVCIAFSPFAVGGYFSGVRVAASGSSELAAPMMPMWLDAMFGSLVIVEDVAAIVYCASLDAGGDGTRGVGLWILDYDLQVLTEGADQWLVGLDDQLRHIADATPAAWHARLMGTYVDDFEQGWANALSQLGVRTNVVGEELPPLAERFNKARPYIARGLVALGPAATRKELLFKGSRRNFLREVVTASAPPESSALALAFATGVLLSYHGRASIPTPTLTPQQFPRPPKPPPPLPPSALMWQTYTGVWHQAPAPEGYKGPLKTRAELGF